MDVPMSVRYERRVTWIEIVRVRAFALRTPLFPLYEGQPYSALTLNVLVYLRTILT